MSNASITVAVCTHNRHRYLGDCLGSLRQQTLSSNSFRVLLVDNSTDADASAKFYEEYSLLENEAVCFLSPPGLSRARNHAARICGTRFIAYIDDDVRASPTWLAAVLNAFLADEHVAGVGGPIVPLWERTPPDWLPNRHIAMLTIVGTEGGDRLLPLSQYLFGANMAFVVEALIEAGGFPEQVGRMGEHTLISCEETRIQDKIRASGGKIKFVTDASVDHIVHSERVCRNWMRSRMAWESVSAHLQNPPEYHPERSAYQLKELCKRRPEMIAAVRAVFDDLGSCALDDQLDLIRHSVNLLLGGKAGGGATSAMLDKVGASCETRLQERIENLERELDIKSSQIASSERGRQAIEAALARTQSKLSAIEHSTAWKATFPVRRIVEFVRRALPALRCR